MGESIQHKLDRIRPPRVQITYDLETGGAMQKKEIPFVMGIMADLSGDKTKTETDRKLLSDPERKFIEIDRDNFDSIMQSIAPTRSIKIPAGDPSAGKFETVDLTFKCIDDFAPLYWDSNSRQYSGVVTQDAKLKDLWECRQKLNDLLAKLDNKVDKDNKTVSDVLLEGVGMKGEFAATVKGYIGAPPASSDPAADKAKTKGGD
ncbi:MAG TPA: type VI secretion system contractile sheath small subunit [Candidatus Saccharimonadales bacterium]|jgi:type VI secretion system protein ImpB|nr:type VI secretion system contractile sheath small subunit [Candidatus Saccharimonadales bacterium]